MRRYVAVLFCVALGSTAHGATIEGNLSVNHGSGFEPASAGAVLRPGDSVMAQPGAGGAIVYSPQCRVPVEAGNIHVVSAEAPCSASTEWAPPAGLGGCSLKGDSRECQVEEEPDRRHLLIGAAVVAAGVGAIILLNDDDDNKPASP